MYLAADERPFEKRPFEKRTFEKRTFEGTADINTGRYSCTIRMLKEL